MPRPMIHVPRMTEEEALVFLAEQDLSDKECVVYEALLATLLTHAEGTAQQADLFTVLAQLFTDIIGMSHQQHSPGHIAEITERNTLCLAYVYKLLVAKATVQHWYAPEVG